MIYDVSIVDRIAIRKGLNPNWLKAIIQKESHGNPWCIRYERDYEYFCNPKQFVDPIYNSYNTEYQAQKFSWGLGQLMGGLIREQGHRGLMAELLIPELNIEHMCIRILKLKTLSPIVQDVFAMYNGGFGARVKTESGMYRDKIQAYVNDVMHNLQSYES